MSHSCRRAELMWRRHSCLRAARSAAPAPKASNRVAGGEREARRHRSGGRPISAPRRGAGSVIRESLWHPSGVRTIVVEQTGGGASLATGYPISSLRDEHLAIANARRTILVPLLGCRNSATTTATRPTPKASNRVAGGGREARRHRSPAPQIHAPLQGRHTPHLTDPTHP